MNAEKRKGLLKTTLINTSAIVLFCTSTLIFKKELNDDGALILLFVFVAYFLGQFSIMFILYKGNRINKQIDQNASVPESIEKSGL